MFAFQYFYVSRITSVTKGGKLSTIFNIIKTYRHDHSLESSWGALPDGPVWSNDFGGKVQQALSE
jgi:hypothetical protein